LSAYRVLLKVSVTHSYYRHGACSCLEFVPTRKTQMLFRNIGMLCKKTNDGIQIIFDENNLETLVKYTQEPLEILSFDFKVYAHDPDFKSYTEPFTAVGNEILYFDNLSIDGSGQQSLSISSRVTEQDFKKPDSPEINNLLDPRDRLLPPVLVLRIFAKNRRTSLLEQWLDSESTVYSVSFNSRETYWKYYLIGKLASQDKSARHYSVVDADSQAKFETTGEELLADQRLAYTFRSKQRIPLNDYYPFRFQLIQQDQDDQTVIIDGLPVANIRQVGMDTVNEQSEVVSEIYINS